MSTHRCSTKSYRSNLTTARIERATSDPGKGASHPHADSIPTRYDSENWLLQVKSLYGPLLAIVQTSKSASQAMVRQHSPDGTRESMVAAIRACPEGPEGVAYRCFCGHLHGHQVEIPAALHWCCHKFAWSGAPPPLTYRRQGKRSNDSTSGQHVQAWQC